MEDQRRAQPVQRSVPVGRGVMDIHRPARQETPQVTAMPEPQQPEAPPQVAEEPIAPSTEASGDTSVPAVPQNAPTEAAADKPQNPLLAAEQSPKRGAPKLAIAIALVVALSLSGLAGLAYLKTQEDAAVSPSDTGIQQEAVPEATDLPATNDVETSDPAPESDSKLEDSEDVPVDGLVPPDEVTTPGQEATER